MTKEQLKAKLDLYTAEKAELKAKSYAAEIDEKVAAYRKEVEALYEAERAADLAKIDNYLTLLAELVSEAEAEEVKAEVVDEAESPATPIVG